MSDAVYMNLYVNGKESSMDEWEQSGVDHLYLYLSNLHLPYPLAARLVKENWDRRVQQGSDERLGQPRNRLAPPIALAIAPWLTSVPRLDRHNKV